MGHHVVVVAGTIGTALADRLARAGHDVTVVSRNRVRSAGVSGVAVVAIDAGDPSALGGLARGADVLYNCAHPASQSHLGRDWSPIAVSSLAAATSSGAVLVTLANLDGYGPVDHALSESDPLAATSARGKARAATWRAASDASRAGIVRATEVRVADLFGPGIISGGILGHRVVPKVLDHETVGLFGDLDAPHSWSYVGDDVRALEVAGSDERAWSRAWHAPTATPRSPREAVLALADAAGLPSPAVRRVPWSLARAASLAVPELRGLHEVAYQFDAPFVVDSTAFTSTFGEDPTAFGEACAATVAWWRRRRGFPLPSLAEVSTTR